MKIKRSKQLVKPFIDQCKKDNDCYLIVHFSKEEDKFAGYDKMDFADALLIIYELIKQYDLNSEVIIESLKQKSNP